MVSHRLLHPAGRALTSDWFVNSLNGCLEIRIFPVMFGKKILNELLNKCIYYTNIIKRFTNQSEVSALPAGCFSRPDVKYEALQQLICT